MAQKIRPTSLRVGVTKNWNSRWLPPKLRFVNHLEADTLIRKSIAEKILLAGIDRVIIENVGNNYKLFIKASRPGLIIGRGGRGVEELTKFLENRLAKFAKEKKLAGSFSISLNIEELKRSEVSAQVVAQNIAWDLEKRLPFRRTMKKCLDQILQHKEVKGAKIKMAGRLDGAEIARSEQLSKGRLPLQTLRADIDYGQATAFTTYGTIGIKVWIYKGEIFADQVG